MDLSTTPLTLPCRAVALLIDGENIAAAMASGALAAARRLGPIATARVYGDARILAGWHEVAGLRLVHAHSGKNVTDMVMTIEAMELSHAGVIDGFALVTNDRDFTPLAQALRSRGFPVLGLVGPTAPTMFRASCSHSVTLALPEKRPPAPQAPAAPAKPAPPRTIPAKPSPLVQSAQLALASGPQHPKTFANAMQAAGHAKPQGHASWRQWLKVTFPALVIDGSGEALRMHLPKG